MPSRGRLQQGWRGRCRGRVHLYAWSLGEPPLLLQHPSARCSALLAMSSFREAHSLFVAIVLAVEIDYSKARELLSLVVLLVSLRSAERVY